MTEITTENEDVLLHSLAMYKQLSQLYPNEAKYLQRYIEILLQLHKYDEAEILLEQLQALLRSSNLTEDAKKAENIRKHLSKEMHESRYYSFPFLHLASSNWLKKLFHTHAYIKIKEGDYLIRHGEIETQMYIVLHGALVVWSRDEQNKKHYEHTLGVGEVIGELAFLDGTARNADVIASQDSELLSIPNKSVFKLFMDDPKVEKALRAEASTRKTQVALKNNRALAKLPSHLQRILAKEGSTIHFQALERVYQSGTNIEYIDLIMSGCLRLVGEKSDGKSLILNSLKEGDLLGCAALTPHMDSKYLADVVSMSESTVIRIPLSVVTKIVGLNPRLYQALLREAEHERDSLLQTITTEPHIDT